MQLSASRDECVGSWRSKSRQGNIHGKRRRARKNTAKMRRFGEGVWEDTRSRKGHITILTLSSENLDGLNRFWTWQNIRLSGKGKLSRTWSVDISPSPSVCVGSVGAISVAGLCGLLGLKTQNNTFTIVACVRYPTWPTLCLTQIPF